MDIDSISDRVDSISERIKKLNYKFRNEEQANEAEKIKEEAVSLLDSWLELVTADYDEFGEEEEEE